MAENDLRLRNTAQLLLAYESGNTRNVDHLTGVALRIFQKLRGQLVPIVGSLGYSTILNLSFRLAQEESTPEFGVEPSSEEEEDLKGLFERLQGADYVQAEKTITAALVEFLGVLTELLGWDLSSRILNAAWPELAIGEES